jgi:MOSC domain-containing protein YiiM
MNATQITAAVVSVNIDGAHRFSKKPVAEIELVAGLGVRGDAHAGVTVQHRSRVRRDPTQPNLRQVHLIHAELFSELGDHVVEPGDLGENITTVGIDLLGLPTNTVLRIGETAAVQVTGLRNPCTQIDDFDDGLLACVVERDDDGEIVRKAGVMGVVLQSGIVRAHDQIVVELPSEATVALAPV